MQTCISSFLQVNITVSVMHVCNKHIYFFIHIDTLSQVVHNGLTLSSFGQNTLPITGSALQLKNVYP